MQRVFGDFIEEDRNNSLEYLVIGFSPTSIPLQQRWRNNGLSADFLADYLTTFFPAHDEVTSEKSHEIKGTVNFIANELLENAMKFNCAAAENAVHIALYLDANVLRLYVRNTVDPDAVAEFQRFIDRLLQEEPAELYFQQVEKNVTRETEQSSGLGFLTILNDYNAKLAWKFESSAQRPDIIFVTTMSQLHL